MTINQRRLFMFFFIFLFLIIAPVIVFFAKGYRFDLDDGIFVYSGSITIKSVPRDIKVFLNNKQQDDKKINYINGSYTINGIKPGDYSLRCEKDGYTSWEKNIEVHSGISTEFWNVTLFPKENSLNILDHTDKNVEQFFLSPRDNQEIVFFAEEDEKRIVYLLDAGTNNIEKIYETDQFYFLDPSEEENVEWSSDNKHIFIPLKDQDGKKNYIIAKIKGDGIENPINLGDIFNQAQITEPPTEETATENKSYSNTNNTEKNEETNTTNTNDAIAKMELPSTAKEISTKTTKKINTKEEVSFKKVRWMFDKTDELVVLTNDHNLFYINFNEPDKKIIIDEQVSGFDFAGNRIYYTQLPNNLVWEIKNNNIESKRQITNQSFAPSEDNFVELTVYDEYRLVIKNKENGNLFIFNEEKEKNEIIIKTIENNVKGIQFSDDGKKLLYWTDSEIWFLMLRDWDVQPVRKKGDNELITRFSERIENVQWLDNYENVLFSVGNKIKSAEIDVRDHVNIVDILDSSSAFSNRNFFYNKRNQTLFLMLPDESGNYKIKSIVLIDAPGIFGFGR